MVFARRRRKTLREEVLVSNKIKQDIESKEVDFHEHSIEHEANIFSSSPSSFKGSLLRNKLENPLFRTTKNAYNSFRSSLKLGSALKHVHSRVDLEHLDSQKLEDNRLLTGNRNDKEEASDSEGEDDEEGTDSEGDDRLSMADDSDLTDSRFERTKSVISKDRKGKPRQKSRILLSFHSKSKSSQDKGQTLKSLRSKKSKHSKHTQGSSKSMFSDQKSRPSHPNKERSLRLKLAERLPNSRSLFESASNTYKRGFLYHRKKSPKQVESKKEKVNSLSSHTSNNSSGATTSSENESEIDMLTRLEEKSNEIKGKENSFLLYTERGERIEVTFQFDYLEINDKICFYEDIASWTNDSKCLRIVYIKNRTTPEQEKVEIKLYVVDKQYKGKVTPYDLNELLRKKISILICDKFKCSMKEAMEMTEKQATASELQSMNERIEKSKERCIAESYTKDIINC